jgi:hypothetical protein
MALIFPKALETAAKTFADRPKMLGEILVALCTDARKMKFSELQEYIIAECMEEMKERAKQRANAAERKRKQRGAK